MKLAAIFGGLVFALGACANVVGDGGSKAGEGDGDVGAARAALTCGLLVCQDDEQCCDFECVDVSTDRDNCGACGVTCDDDEACSSGVCHCAGTLCSSGDTCCGTAGCVDTSSDPNNCGGCGVTCGDEELCVGGTCACLDTGGTLDRCGAGEACCPGIGCKDLEDDALNCGACGLRCGDGELCEGGLCRCGSTSALYPGATVCTDGEACCGGYCRDAAECECGTTTCAGDNECCVDNLGSLVCVNPDDDENNCGECGNRCRAREICLNGRCRCGPGLADCNGIEADGCETLLYQDELNCGACGNVCPAGYLCASLDDGERYDCVPSGCPVGLTECDDRCTDVRSDSNNCGYCGNRCPSGERCSGGVCDRTCLSGFTDCGDGCYDLMVDSNHCGACRTACDSGEACAVGACTISCLPHQSECGGECVNLQTDRNNCGACGNACASGEVCDGTGSCTINCQSELTHCSGSCVDLDTDEANCGSCATACATGESCEEGSCACPADRAACGDAGCIDIQSDSFHCGACGAACGGEAACALGVCDERLFRLEGLSVGDCSFDEAFGAGGPLAVEGDVLLHRAPSELTIFNAITLRDRDHFAAGPAVIVSDLSAEVVWALGDAAGPHPGGVSGLVTHLYGIDPRTGRATSAAPVPLSMDVPFPTGIFAGWGRIVVITPGDAYDIDLVTGQVSELPLAGPLGASTCTGGGPFAGVVELLGGGLHVSYIRGDDVVRTRLSDGATLTLLASADLGDACAFTASPAMDRWFLHSRGASRWQVPPDPVLDDATDPRPDPELYEHIVVSCPATFQAAGLACTAVGGP